MKILGQTYSQDDEFRLLTVKDVAALLDMSVRTIWRRRNDGSIPPPVRVGGAIRWRLIDIRSWIANGCICGAATD